MQGRSSTFVHFGKSWHTGGILRVARSVGTCQGVYLLYVLILACTSIYYLGRSPIIAGDTDLWYHLNGGRYIFEHKSLPQDSFFSFISPAREWIDYYWLFQALVYAVYSLCDYYGLIILRTLIYAITLVFVIKLLMHQQDNDDAIPWASFAVPLYILFLVPRYQLVRPHMVTYLFIALFLYILECNPRRAIYLPFLALLWVNLHGIVYPIILLIAVSYLVDFFMNRLKNKTPFRKQDLAYLIPVLLSTYAIFLTPHGLTLLRVPFVSTLYASQYIAELRPLRVDDLLSFQIFSIIISYSTIFNFIIILGGLALMLSAQMKTIQVRHLLLLAGGIFLLTKGDRFRYEFALLLLPMLGMLSSKVSINRRRISSTFVLPIFIGVLMIMPFLFLRGVFPRYDNYPFSSKNLPHGVVSFLNHINTGGTVFNHPNTGGYLQWALYPRYKIFMDMEVPFLFTDEDFYRVSNTFFDKNVLRKVVLEYEPSFFTVPHIYKEFKELINEYPSYIMVFFDDVDVLYMNKEELPDIAKIYEIKEIDPFSIFEQDVTKWIEERNRDLLRDELTKLVAIAPASGITNYLLGTIDIGEEAYDRAIFHADTIIRNSPESPAGYRLKGDALKGQRSFNEAIAFYRLALKRGDGIVRQQVYKAIGLAYTEQGKYQEAYSALQEAIDIFSPKASYKDVYRLAFTAVSAGKTTEAPMLLKFADEKVPPQETELKELIKKHLALLGATK